MKSSRLKNSIYNKMYIEQNLQNVLVRIDDSCYMYGDDLSNKSILSSYLCRKFDKEHLLRDITGYMITGWEIQQRK